ncbi:hypothetical protein K0L52_003215 [Vibrio fluvialis]|nr:hypothetical protein [Vibrio fluvialis]
MKRLKICICLFFINISYANAECRDILELAARNYYSTYTLNDIRAFFYNKYCGSSSTQQSSSVSAAMSVLLEQYPIGLSLGGTNSSSEVQSWCKQNQSLSSYKSIYQEINSTVFSPSIQSWQSCELAAQNNVAVETNISGGGAIIQSVITNRSAHDEYITGVTLVTSDKSKINCKIYDSNGDLQVADENSRVLMEKNKAVTLLCTRKATELTLDNKKYEGYLSGEYQISNILSPYLYSFPVQYTKFPPIDKPTQPEKLVVDLSGTIAFTRGYWSSGKHHSDFKAPIKFDNTKFEFITWDGYIEKNVGKRKTGYALTDSGAKDYCNGAGESCSEFFFRHACLVNKSWVNWYKEYMKSTGSEIVQAQLCSK